jgi:hypothetical protein
VDRAGTGPDRLRRKAEAIDQARPKLAHLHKLLDQPRGTKDTETPDLMHGAEAMIAPQAATIER